MQKAALDGFHARAFLPLLIWQHPTKMNAMSLAWWVRITNGFCTIVVPGGRWRIAEIDARDQPQVAHIHAVRTSRSIYYLSVQIRWPSPDARTRVADNYCREMTENFFGEKVRMEQQGLARTHWAASPSVAEIYIFCRLACDTGRRRVPPVVAARPRQSYQFAVVTTQEFRCVNFAKN
jgi:hypothetical protein